MPAPDLSAASSPRRDFLKGLGACACAAVAVAVPTGAGLNAFLQPLRVSSDGAGILRRLTTLEALPADGIPRRFQVVADRVNVWNRTPGVPVGAVYLVRRGEKEIKAFNVTCPHAGCVVDFAPDKHAFLCPCHNSTFALDGAVNDPKSPSPRGLDELAVEIREGREVWVRFQNFRVGVHERVPA